MSFNRRRIIKTAGAGFLAETAFTAGLAGKALAQDAGAAASLDLSDIHNPVELGDIVLGPETAKVTVVEYLSASCPHCAHFWQNDFPKIKADYIDTGKIRFIMREFPHNDQAMAAFMVARCLPPEKYMALLEVYFTTQQEWVADAYNKLKNIAQQAGMTEVDFESCLKNEKIAKAIWSVRQKAEEKYGVQGIPTFFVNGQPFKGRPEFTDLKAAIDPLL